MAEDMVARRSASHPCLVAQRTVACIAAEGCERGLARILFCTGTWACQARRFPSWFRQNRLYILVVINTKDELLADGLAATLWLGNASCVYLVRDECWALTSIDRKSPSKASRLRCCWDI